MASITDIPKTHDVEKVVTIQGDSNSHQHIGRRLSITPGEAYDLSPVQGTSTQRGLKSRHAQMIALGGTIGTGLFVGSGQGLRIGGPVFLLVAYCLISFLVLGIVSHETIFTHDHTTEN